MADFPNNGVLHDDPDLTAAARAHRGTKRNARKRRARAAKAERKANDPAFAAAEEAASKAKIENNLRKKKIEEAKMAKYGRKFRLHSLAF